MDNQRINFDVKLLIFRVPLKKNPIFLIMRPVFYLLLFEKYVYKN